MRFRQGRGGCGHLTWQGLGRKLGAFLGAQAGQVQHSRVAPDRDVGLAGLGPGRQQEVGHHLSRFGRPRVVGNG
ncbi:hypothetical protein RZS08_25465, partial [Arthrospira platensis SPKY1]|nr:hypothetical protein [Arthrospira platensis SPKY1]